MRGSAMVSSTYDEKRTALLPRIFGSLDLLAALVVLLGVFKGLPARWWVVEAVDKKRARLNCIHHLLSQIPYEEIPREPVVLPTRVHNPEYHRAPVPAEMYVPAIY